LFLTTNNSLPNMTVSTSYDLNTYSYDSDVACGVEYVQRDSGQVLKGKISLSKVFMAVSAYTHLHYINPASAINH
jgi:hypothetical protein